MLNIKKHINMKMQIDMNKLNEAIEAAFNLGKMYASDELASIGMEVPRAGGNAWDVWIENKGGHTLYAGDAKRQIMTELVMSGELGDALQFD